MTVVTSIRYILLASKYNKLLNSVPSPEPEMMASHNDIKTSMKDRCCTQSPCTQSADREVICQIQIKSYLFKIVFFVRIQTLAKGYSPDV